MPDSHIQAPPASASRLRIAFTSKPIDPVGLKDAVCAYVDAMKLLGVSVERVIVDIKRVAEVEGGPVYRASMRKDAQEIRDAKKLVDDAVRWSIDHYYSGTRPHDRPKE